MANYTVQMTFEAPALREPIDKTLRLHGWAAALQMLGDGGMLAVSASKVVADSPSDAAHSVSAAVIRAGRPGSATPAVPRPGPPSLHLALEEPVQDVV